MIVKRSIKAPTFKETPPSKGTREEGSCFLETYAIYQYRDFTDFTLEMDVFAADNDGMGIVWGVTSQDKHHRIIMINGKWPSPALDKEVIGLEEPWYKIIEIVKDSYNPYMESKHLHWTFSVIKRRWITHKCSSWSNNW